MDFLDPRKRKRDKNRLMLIYMLMTVLVIVAGYLVFKATEGYGVDTKTGQIIQNGLLFVSSQPKKADVLLDDQLQSSRTPARLILPAGAYSMTLEKSGYRTWQRNVTLEEHGVARLTYPLLIPEELNSQAVDKYDNLPPLATQSPNSRWILVQVSGSSFKQYDSANPTLPAATLSIPRSILTSSGSAKSRLSVVEWASNSNFVLLRHNYGSGFEYIIFYRTAPAQSININHQLNVSPTSVALRDKNQNLLYLYFNKTQQLQTGNISDRTLSVLLKDVIEFNSFGPDQILYIKKSSASSKQALVYLWDGRQSYLLKSIKAATKYSLDLAQYEGHWYYALGSDKANQVDIFKDSLDSLRAQSSKTAAPLLAIPIASPQQISFSTNRRFIAAQSGQKVGVYDIEIARTYKYGVKAKLTGLLRWSDGYRLQGLSGGHLLLLEYDSNYLQKLMSVAGAGEGFFSSDYQNLFVLAKNKSGAALLNYDMRAGDDLPR